MGKGGDLWDDAALINAFDSAMRKHKMHKNERDDSNGEGRWNASLLVDESKKWIRESHGNNKAVSSAETSYVSPDKGNHSEDLCAPETCVDSSNRVEDDSCLHDADYNQLLRQYYEIEEKRQTVMQQLNQSRSWNYQCSGEGTVPDAHWAACSAYQDYMVPMCQASHPAVVCSCCPYVSQCMASPCTSLLCGTSGCQPCSDSSIGKGTGKAVVEDGGMVKTAVEAAEQAISSIAMKKDVDAHANEVKEDGGKLPQSTSSQSDLNEVLKAWYSAGFYTGKYLAEQSIAKNSHS